MFRLRSQAIFFLVPAAIIIISLMLIPLLNVVGTSFGLDAQNDGPGVTWQNYATVVTSDYFREIVVRTILMAAGAALLATIMGVPIAYYISRCAARIKGTLIILTLFPLLIGAVVLSIGWVAILSPSGVLSQLLRSAGILEEPLGIMQTPPTLMLLMSLIGVPFVVLSAIGSFDALSPAQERAARSLGATSRRTMFSVILPQVMPGILSGITLTFVLTVNAYATPTLIGGSRVRMVSPEVYDLVTRDGNWPVASALALVVIALSLGISGSVNYLTSAYFDRWREHRR